MAERPIIFSGDMVRAILAGRKTQTRRVVKGSRCKDSGATLAPCEIAAEVNGGDYRLCPYGVPGDTLWVRERWGAPDCDRPGVPDGRKPQPGDRIVYAANDADAWQWREGLPWRPSIHMPRWASRITLRVTGVRVERLRDISAEDALSEGVAETTFYDEGERMASAGAPRSAEWLAFAYLWQSIYGPDSWEANPWVWVVEFKKEAPPCMT